MDTLVEKLWNCCNYFWRVSGFPDLVTFTEEIFNGKLQFLCIEFTLLEAFIAQLMISIRVSLVNVTSFLWIWSHLLKKSVMENFIFRAVVLECFVSVTLEILFDWIYDWRFFIYSKFLEITIKGVVFLWCIVVKLIQIYIF